MSLSSLAYVALSAACCLPLCLSHLLADGGGRAVPDQYGLLWDERELNLRTGLPSREDAERATQLNELLEDERAVVWQDAGAPEPLAHSHSSALSSDSNSTADLTLTGSAPQQAELLEDERASAWQDALADGLQDYSHSPATGSPSDLSTDLIGRPSEDHASGDRQGELLQDERAAVWQGAPATEVPAYSHSPEVGSHLDLSSDLMPSEDSGLGPRQVELFDDYRDASLQDTAATEMPAKSHSPAVGSLSDLSTYLMLSEDSRSGLRQAELLRDGRAGFLQGEPAIKLRGRGSATQPSDDSQPSVGRLLIEEARPAVMERPEAASGPELHDDSGLLFDEDEMFMELMPLSAPAPVGVDEDYMGAAEEADPNAEENRLLDEAFSASRNTSAGLQIGAIASIDGGLSLLCTLNAVDLVYSSHMGPVTSKHEASLVLLCPQAPLEEICTDCVTIIGPRAPLVPYLGGIGDSDSNFLLLVSWEDDYEGQVCVGLQCGGGLSPDVTAGSMQICFVAARDVGIRITGYSLDS